MIVRSTIKSFLVILVFLTGSESNNGGLASAYRRGDAYGGGYGGRPSRRAVKACLAAAAVWSFSCLQVVTSGDECLVERFGTCEYLRLCVYASCSTLTRIIETIQTTGSSARGGTWF